jgi:Zn-dependent protease
MLQTLYVGQLLGIKIYIHWTFWLLAIYVVVFDLEKGLFGALAALGFVFIVFACVFLHEMGHAMAAKWFGIKTIDITMLPIGGLARMGEFPQRPVVELVVAIAGPMVNVVIAIGLIIGLSLQSSFTELTGRTFLSMRPMEQLLSANIGLVVFNMLPSFPMDGGRVLRSTLAMMMPYSKATRVAAKVGQVMAILMFSVGIYYFHVFGISLLLIAGMVFMVCSGELVRERLKQATEEMMNRGAPTDPFSGSNGGQPGQGDTIDAVEVRRVT